MVTGPNIPNINNAFTQVDRNLFAGFSAAAKGPTPSTSGKHINNPNFTDQFAGFDAKRANLWRPGLTPAELGGQVGTKFCADC